MNATFTNELWFKRAVIYELHVRSFCDGNNDGIGDFQGLKSRLGYLKNLGVTALWLLPFYPSPLRDDGYDIADYFSIHPDYGTLQDFQEFLQAAHACGLRVITELVINHTSDRCEWFQRARRAPEGTVERNYYVWSDDPRRFADARIIFRDFETSNWAWDAEAKSYYWHRFFSHQPDLNFDNPEVRKAVFQVFDYWLEMGVDGMRLDAVPYLYEREGTICENLPETHDFLRALRRHVDEKFPGRMLLAEANQWPEDAAAYFGNGDECHMSFHFPLMPRLFMAIQMEDRFPILDILEQTPAIPENCQWAIFLRNHDELTLEMVTDEERDYMYRMYARDPRARVNLGIRRRLAPLLENNRRKIELINSLLFSLPGTPILYYGDEIGMGDNFYLGDRNGVRTPMQWSADRNAGFSRCNPQQLFLPVIIDPEYHYESVNVDAQEKNLSSLFWWMKRLLEIQRSHSAFAEGKIEFLDSENPKVLSYLRTNDRETILVLANLSRFAQATRLELSKYRGYVPYELFGSNTFPEIADGPATFTLGPHGFFWLELRLAANGPNSGMPYDVPPINLDSKWSESLKRELENVIFPGYLHSCRWYGDKHRVFKNCRIVGDFALKQADGAHILLLEITFADGTSSIQVLPLVIVEKEEKENSVLGKFGDGRLLCDAIYTSDFRKIFVESMAKGEKWGDFSRWIGSSSIPKEMRVEPVQSSKVLSGEQSNTSVSFNDKWIFKFYRRFEPGRHAGAEILHALAEKSFPHSAPYGGEVRCEIGGEEAVIGLFTGYVSNQGDGWSHALDTLERFFEKVLTMNSEQEPPDIETIESTYPERIRQLAGNTAALHKCLKSIAGPEFEPEIFTPFYQRSLYQGMRSLARRTTLELRRKLAVLPPPLQQIAEEWIEKSPGIPNAYRQLLDRKIAAARIRVHGDYHLGQVLNTGNDFVIMDFDGEPRRSPAERLAKRSPLVDVAGMIRSFDYAVHRALEKFSAADRQRLQPLAMKWLEHIMGVFWEGYLSSISDAELIPPLAADRDLLLRIFLLDKAIYEIGYELSYRPAYLEIPLRASLQLLSLME